MNRLITAALVVSLYTASATKTASQTLPGASPPIVALDDAQLQPCTADQASLAAVPAESETNSVLETITWHQSQAMKLNFSQPDQALAHICVSRALATEANNAPGLAESSRILGILFYSREQLDAARHWINQAISAYIKLGEDLQLGKAYNVRGALSARNSDFSGALNDFNAAIKSFERAENPQELSRARSNTAALLMLIGDHERGMEYMQEVTNGQVARKEMVSAGISYSNMATSYFSEMDEPDLALTYANRALETLQNVNPEDLPSDQQGLYNSYLVQSLTQRARINNALAQYPQAIRDIEQIESLIETMNSPEDELVFNTVRAVAYSNTGRIEEAVNIARQAISGPAELPDPHAAVAISSEIAQVLASAGAYKEAYEQVTYGLHRTREERGSAVSNAVIRANIEFDAERNQQIAYFATQRANLAEVQADQQQRFLILLTAGLIVVGFMALGLFNVNEKRRLAIARLTRTNDELDSTKGRLQRLLSDREILLREINHRVKNNLQIVASLMGRQARAAPDHHAQNVLGHMRTRINAMALIHNQLYGESLNQVVEMQDYFKEFAKMLHSAYTDDGLNIDVSVTPEANVQLDVDTAIPLALLMSELVTNAVSHAFPEHMLQNKLIKIELEAVGEDMLRLSVQDNGVGMQRDAVKPETSDGFGMRLIADLSQQLGGEYNFELSPTGGARISVTFAKPQ